MSSKEMSDWKSTLIVVSALGSGLIGGIFFAFSSFIMKALARVPPTHGIAVMQSINVTVLNIWFSRCSLGLERAASCLASVRSFAGRNQAQVICSPAVCFISLARSS